MSLFKYGLAKRKREESCEGNDEEVDAPMNVNASPVAKTRHVEDTSGQEGMCCEICCAAGCGVVLVA